MSPLPSVFPLLRRSGGALQLLPGCAARRAAGSGGSVEPLLAQMAEQILAEYPENSTTLGLDKGARAGLKSRLTDRSLHGRARLAGAAADRLRRLQAVDRTGLVRRPDPLESPNRARLAVEGFSFPYGDVSLSTRFILPHAPMGSPRIPPSSRCPTSSTATTWSRTPPIRKPISPAGKHIRGRSTAKERLAHERGIGVVAPDFLLDKTLKR